MSHNPGVLAITTLSGVGPHSRPPLLSTRGTRTGGGAVFDAGVAQGTQHPAGHVAGRTRGDRGVRFARVSGARGGAGLLSVEKLLAPQFHPAGREERHVRDAVHGHASGLSVRRGGSVDGVVGGVRQSGHTPVVALARVGRRSVLGVGLFVPVRGLARQLFSVVAVLASAGVAVGASR